MSETAKELLFASGKPKSDCFYNVDRCPLCDFAKSKRLFTQWGIGYYRCMQCGFVYSNPRLTGRGAYVWYNSGYYNAAMATEHYIAENYSQYYSESLAEFHTGKLFELFRKHVRSKDVHIADVGCGSGALLHYLRDEEGYGNVVGFDLNSSNSEFARRFRGLDLRNEDIYDLRNPGQFDVVVTTENIEHVSQPNEYIQAIGKFMVPGGYLVLTTPHNDRKAVGLMGLYGDHFCAPNHQNYFNLTNLRSLLSRHDFNVVDYWLDDTIRFNPYAFLKRFLTERDQVTCDPPDSATIGTIWKWQKDRSESVSVGPYAFRAPSPEPAATKKKRSPKALLKSLIQDIVAIRFTTHQIVVAKYGKQ